MEQAATSSLWILLLSGLAATALGAIFLLKPGTRSGFFRAINPAIKPALTAKLSAGFLAVGATLLVVFLFEVIPFPHSRPFWVVVLSLVLSPLAMLGLTAIFLVAVFKRN
jgi:hypothetical protein